MLPFPRLVEYGNIVVNKKWYDGTEVIAFDSLNYNSAGFFDYNGNPISVGVYQNGGVLPTVDSKPIFKGTGIKIPYSCYVARPNTDVSFLNKSFTVDFWMCQSESSGTMQLSATPIAAYPNTSYNTYTNRFLVAEANGTLYQWNNSTSGTSWGQSYPDLLSTSYVHFALTYDGTAFRVYTNGVLQQVISKTTAQIPLPTPSTSQVIGLLGQGGYQPTKFSIIDRYRLRSTVVWTSNFNTSTIYP